MSIQKFTFTSLIVIGSVALVPSLTRAAVVDSDQDGLSDSAETEVYHTDPNTADTDGDGIPDGQEIIEGTNPLDPEDSISRTIDAQTATLQKQFFDPEKIAWYAGRAAGIAAFILLTLSIANGLLMSTRTSFPSWPTFLSYETHRTLSWSALALVVLHFVSLTLDKYLKLSFAEALIPGWLHREFFSTLGFNLTVTVGLGIIAFYLLIILSITAEFRAKIAPRSWRAIHYLSFLAYIIFLIHGITSGTDSRQWWMIWIYGLSTLIVLSLTAFRIILVFKKKNSVTPIPSPPNPLDPAL